MRSGFDPTRRSKNISTARQGHGANNHLAVPWPGREERVRWAQLRQPSIAKRNVCGRELQFIVDAHLPDWRYACSIEDVCTLLTAIPPHDWQGINTFIFRQSTRKQWLLYPTWGRLAMWADVGVRGMQAIHSGPAILIEAINPSTPFRWARSLTPAMARELERLRADGHTVVQDSRGYKITSSLCAARATQLYRTIPHEIGHWVDWCMRVERPAENEVGEYSELADRYWARPSMEREAFAHQYATDLLQLLKTTGELPFREQLQYLSMRTTNGFS